MTNLMMFYLVSQILVFFVIYIFGQSLYYLTPRNARLRFNLGQRE